MAQVERPKKEYPAYIHSACCGRHWELCANLDGSLVLCCENCGKPTKLKFESKISLERGEGKEVV